jgi:hypothetical protein
VSITRWYQFVPAPLADVAPPPWINLRQLPPTTWAITVVAVVGGLAVLLVLWRLLRRKPVAKESVPLPLAIDVTKLAQPGPPPSDVQVTVYNIPMRLALVVLAPAGREGKIPPDEMLGEVIDGIAPNLLHAKNSHMPLVRRWPPQLSSQGFTQVFFTNVPLPGDGGKGTAWCSLAGRVEAPSGPVLAGLVLVAEKPNSLGQIAVNQASQWLDIVRVKLK